MTNTQLVIVTGLSGAGKSEAIRSFEDLGYFCVDNLPPALIPKFAELCAHSEGKAAKAALVTDIRGRHFFDSLQDALEELERKGFTYEILFLEASDEALVRRFKETRRRHPLATGGDIVQAIAEERARLEEIRGRAHRIVDTSSMTPRQLRAGIEAAYGDPGGGSPSVTVVSFGFKHGLPIDADMVFDVRFLPNPHYVEKLRHLSGLDEAVADYVFRWPVTQRYLEKLFDMMDFVMPQFVAEGKSHLVLAVGCTGGKHRSVAIGEKLGAHLRERGYRVRVHHRDLDRAGGERGPEQAR
ncbi:MAG: RNase adapter RapZ [Clostridia bacterium]|nr:RNase adapter RapZ [Bacillota bacterium]MBO2521021.1 RNase adapter RapZ [Bacillota bacterium]